MKRLSFIFSALWLIVATHAYAGGIVVGPIGGVPSGVTNGTGVDSGPIGPSSPAGVPTIGGVPASPYANFASSLYYYNGVTYGDLPTWLTALGGTFTRASNGTYTNSAGLLATASSNVARFDYNPSTLAANGILLEGARTNLTVQSNTFSNASWTKSNVGAPSQNVAGPDGTTSAWTVTTTASNNVHEMFMGITLATATTVSVSVMAKQGTSKYLLINYQGTTGNWISAVFDLSAGAGSATQTGQGATSGTVVSTSITNAPNGFLRASLTGSLTGANGSVVYGFATAATGNTFNTFGEISFNAAGTETLILSNTQAEAASFPSSYIATTTGSVTRAADSLTFPFTQTIFTAYLKETTNEDSTGTTGYRMLASGTADNRYMYRNNATTANALANAIALTYPAFSGTWATSHKFIIAGNASSRSTTVDGNVPTTDANALTNGTVSTIQLGDSPASSQPNFGTFGELALWNNLVASAADQERLTTLP